MRAQAIIPALAGPSRGVRLSGPPRPVGVQHGLTSLREEARRLSGEITAVLADGELTRAERRQLATQMTRELGETLHSVAVLESWEAVHG